MNSQRMEFFASEILPMLNKLIELCDGAGISMFAMLGIDYDPSLTINEQFNVAAAFAMPKDNTPAQLYAAAEIVKLDEEMCQVIIHVARKLRQAKQIHDKAAHQVDESSIKGTNFGVN